ncbi:acyl-CoA dehydrogenase family protein [Streptomyces sp. NPDC021020]|uniref:acyl-CoA dehydrogenase family protein n=1 Tax=Streptomyces sp. NPDC021020 TaxID=3365109 RepID=UPI003787DB00
MTGAFDLDGLGKALDAAAADIDATGDPEGVGLGLLREHGLMGCLVPASLGGGGEGVAVMLAIAERIGAHCPGLAVLWVMHCQQVAILDRYADEPLRGDVLRAVARDQHFLASITTEPGKGGHLMTARAALGRTAGTLRFSREAPVVSGGLHADAYLITMRRAEDSVPDDVVLVHAPRDAVQVTPRGPVDMLGMRGASNVSLTVDVCVPPENLIDPPGGFARIGARTMVPLGHLGWSAAWLGAARAALRHVLRRLRADGAGSIRRDDDVLDRVARARLRVDTVEAVVLAGLREFEARSGRELDHPAFHILVNNVKVVASEQTFRAVDELVEVGGLGLGYRRGPDLVLERIFRDLRSATLMYGNHRLVRASGKLALLDAGAQSLRAGGLATML